ncbi:hypothetical protein llap_11561 [Limosa lapponica baueri]|uniref:Uncharacterized protein n=1 Tax=Limosa lapponica baueri TaxID=1758121 RepID=A0A2I0TWE3_LIMLA|nr:hypothetical protein llap_11561 [Limosa lapponica baueri]
MVHLLRSATSFWRKVDTVYAEQPSTTRSLEPLNWDPKPQAGSRARSDEYGCSPLRPTLAYILVARLVANVHGEPDGGTDPGQDHLSVCFEAKASGTGGEGHHQCDVVFWFWD